METKFLHGSEERTLKQDFHFCFISLVFSVNPYLEKNDRFCMMVGSTGKSGYH